MMRLVLEEESGGESAILAWQAGRGMTMTAVHACGSRAWQRCNSTRPTSIWPALVRAGGLEALLRDHRTGDLSLFAVKECLEVVARRGVDLKKYSDARMYSNTSLIARQIAGLMLRLLFRFNKSVQRSSVHALADRQEIKISYYALLNTGRELGVDMPTMSSFEQDITRFADSHRN